MSFFSVVSAARKYPSVSYPYVTDQLVFNLDANNTSSYPGTGDSWYDLVGSNDGTLSGGASYSSSGGNHIEFDGIDDYVELGSVDSSNPLSFYGFDGITIEVWVRPDDSGDVYQRIIDKSNGGSGASGYCLYYRPDNNRFGLQINGEQFPYDGYVNANVNQWQQIVVTRDFTSTSLSKKYYKNGSQSTTNDSVVSASSDTTNCRIGTWNHSDGREFNGGIGIVRLYSKVLSSQEITQNWNANRDDYGI